MNNDNIVVSNMAAIDKTRHIDVFRSSHTGPALRTAVVQKRELMQFARSIPLSEIKPGQAKPTKGHAC